MPVFDNAPTPFVPEPTEPPSMYVQLSDGTLVPVASEADGLALISLDGEAIWWCTYDPSTGRLTGYGTATNLNDARVQATPGKSFIICGGPVDDRTHYVLDGVETLRPIIAPMVRWEIVADGTDQIELPVPNGTGIVVDGEVHGTADDGRFEFAAEEPGTYRIELKPPFPYRELICEVVAS